jgi:transposase-like protein
VTKQELQRGASRRLAILRHCEKVTHNVSKTFRYYGISRTVFYKWKQRYEEGGLEGLQDLSRSPLSIAPRRLTSRWWERSSTCVRR